MLHHLELQLSDNPDDPIRPQKGLENLDCTLFGQLDETFGWRVTSEVLQTLLVPLHRS